MENIANVPQETTALPLMSNLDIVRAWKDAAYRRSLSAEQLEQLPVNPAGPSQFSNDELVVASGAKNDFYVALTTALACTEWTFHSWKACGCP
jgi:mersacidin/lichenicidin family type 2 lantibiotic